MIITVFGYIEAQTTDKVLAVVIFPILIVIHFYLFGNLGFGSKTKKEASECGKETYLYVADKNIFNLLDGTTLKIDTACVKVSCIYKDGKKVIDAPHGFVFIIPFKKSVPNTFTFTLSLLDTTNTAFTNGISEDLCQVYPIKLGDELKIILKQKNTNPSIGWIKPSTTDIITYTRIN